MQNNTENHSEIDFIVSLLDSEKKTQRIVACGVLNLMPQLTSWLISRLRKQKLTLQQIGEMIGVNKSICFKLQNNQFFPKSDKKRKELIKKVIEVIDKNEL